MVEAALTRTGIAAELTAASGRRCCRSQRLGMSTVVAAFVLSHKGFLFDPCRKIVKFALICDILIQIAGTEHGFSDTLRIAENVWDKIQYGWEICLIFQKQKGRIEHK